MTEQKIDRRQFIKSAGKIGVGLGAAGIIGTSLKVKKASDYPIPRKCVFARGAILVYA